MKFQKITPLDRRRAILPVAAISNQEIEALIAAELADDGAVAVVADASGRIVSAAPLAPELDLIRKIRR